MKLGTVMDRLRAFRPPDGWQATIFLFPDSAMEEMFDHVPKNEARHCLELGTGFGATTCVLAAAIDEIGGGRIVTIDQYLHEPVNVRRLLEHVGLSSDLVDAVAEPLGYNWWLADQLRNGFVSSPSFDLCFLDGAHEFQPDALAFHLAARLLKRGGTFVFDDLNFHLRQVSNWRDVFASRSDRELDTEQIRMLWDLVVLPHPAFHRFRITCDGRVGWAQKRRWRWFG